jgi:phosphoglycolate phosphatase-like HAD superfamily hydrolase
MYRRLFIYRLVLWNIDLTLVDVARVSRDAYADAFRRVTGRPLVALPQMAGKSDSEIFFESLALNEASADTAGAAGDAAADAARDVGPAGDPGAANLELLGRYTAQLVVGAIDRLTSSVTAPG